MPNWIIAALFALFLVHLLAFARLAMVRRLPYYWLLSALFLVLTLSFGLRLWQPELLVGQTPLWRLLRYLAWAMAAITLPVLVWRVLSRRRW